MKDYKKWWSGLIPTQKAVYTAKYFQETELNDEEIMFIHNNECGDSTMEKPYRYVLLIQIYGTTKEIKISTDWKLGILQASQFSEQLAKKWTRHINCESLVRHCDQYHDLYNEGSIKLIRKELA